MGNSQMKPAEEVARAWLESAHSAREQGLAASRSAIRDSANAIRSIHRGEFERAETLIGEARQVLDEAVIALDPHPEVRYAGFISDAQKELAEAQITFSLVANGEMPDIESLGVGPIEMLGGLAESVGELRRHLLDTLRGGDIERGEAILDQMDEIYGLLASIDFPDALTRGLRSRTDAARGIIERSRSDLTMTVIQRQVVEALSDREP